MKVKVVVKKAIKDIICIKAVNVLLKILLKPFSSLMPANILNRIPVVGPISVQLPFHKELRLDSDGYDSIASKLYWNGISSYESGSILAFIKLLKYIGSFIDVGANTGIYALIAAIEDPNRKVYAFEPAQRTLFWLKKNVEINQLKNLMIDSHAISNFDGNITLYVPSNKRQIPTSASTLEGFRNDCEIVSVPALTIDSFVAMRNIPSVDMIKIDTEGTEHLVLEGARNIIKRDEPIIICEVLRGLTEKYLHDVLDNLDYRYFWVSSNGLIEKQQIEGDETYKNLNYIFIPKRKMPKIMEEIITLEG